MGFIRNNYPRQSTNLNTPPATGQVNIQITNWKLEVWKLEIGNGRVEIVPLLIMFINVSGIPLWREKLVIILFY